MARRLKNMGSDFRRKNKRLSRALDNDIPAMIGEEHKNGFRRSFRDQRFYDHGTKTWKKPERTYKGKGAARTRNTLIGKAGAGGSGLQDSFRVLVRRNEVSIQNTKVYAKIHNEGGTITTKHATIKMPQRQFMGHSTKIDEDVEREIDKELNIIFD